MDQPVGSRLVAKYERSKGDGMWSVWEVPQPDGNIVLVCDCPSWRNKHTDNKHRTCKHCARFLGVTQIK